VKPIFESRGLFIVSVSLAVAQQQPPDQVARRMTATLHVLPTVGNNALQKSIRPSPKASISICPGRCADIPRHLEFDRRLPPP
jgi:hypothetical protein